METANESTPDSHDPVRTDQDASIAKVEGSPLERMAATVVGGVLALYGLRRKSLAGSALAVAGSGIALLSAAPHPGERLSSLAESALRLLPGHQTVRFTETITIQKDPGDIYAFFSDFNNLKHLTRYFDRLEQSGENQARWSLRLPLGVHLTGMTEVTAANPGESLTWRSKADEMDLSAEETLRLKPLEHERGTVVEYEAAYTMPAGRALNAVTSLVQMDPRSILKTALRHARNLLETGEIPSTAGQPRGQC